MNEKKLLIFDMDGLMFETEKLAYRAYYQAAQQYDFELNHNVCYYLTGQSESDIREKMSELYGRDVSKWRDTINDNKNKILEEDKRVYKKKGLVELLNFAVENKIKIALASSSDSERIRSLLKLEKVDQFFDIIVAGTEVKKSKPNPEIFLKACEKSNVEPRNAIVLEDSKAGIEAANSAGITSILIEDDITSLPTWSGKIKLLKDLSKYRDKPAPANYQFQDLLEVKQFLTVKKCFID